MPWNGLIDFTGRKTSRISSPELWDDMYIKRYIDDTLKSELIDEKKLHDKVSKLEWYLFISNERYCYLVCLVDGLEYRNCGTGWQCCGGAEIAKKIYGKRLIRV